jgi:hypothetical protein
MRRFGEMSLYNIKGLPIMYKIACFIIKRQDIYVFSLNLNHLIPNT